MFSFIVRYFGKLLYCVLLYNYTSRSGLYTENVPLNMLYTIGGCINIFSRL